MNRSDQEEGRSVSRFALMRMQRQIFRFGLVYGLVGLLLLAGASAGCKKKRYRAPTFSASTGDALLGGGGGIAQRIRVWAQVSESQAAPGEQATVNMIAYVTDVLGLPMPDDTVVVWLATIGSLDEATSTTIQGVASVTLTFPPNFTGCSRVTAICGEAQAIQKVCADVSPRNIAMWASRTDLDWNGSASVTAKLTTDGKPDVGFQVDFTVTVSDDDVIVNTRPALSVITDDQGNATIYLEVENTTTDPAYITVTAEAEDERSAELVIVVRPEGAAPTRLIVVTSDAPNNTMGATDTTNITATVTEDGTPVSGVPVTFSLDSTDYGIFGSASTVVTDAAGQATVTFQAANTSGDNQMVAITATTSDDTNGALDLRVLASSTVVVGSDAPNDEVAATGTTTITAVVATAGLPLSGASVTFSVSTTAYGNLTGASTVVTDAAGRATVTFQAANTSTGDQTVTLTATVTDGGQGTLDLLILAP